MRHSALTQEPPGPPAAAPPAGRWGASWRRLRARFGPRRAEVVYSARYSFRFPGGLHDPVRGERVLAFLCQEGLLHPRHLLVPDPASWETLRSVHTDAYLESLHEPGALAKVFGLTLNDDETDQLIEAQRTMAAGSARGAERALATRRVVCNLGGGLHHALLDRGQGFCIFNDVALAVRRLRRRGFTGRVLVVDLDLHDGDGTRAIFAHDPTVHTFSIHNGSWGHEEAVAATGVTLAGEVDDAGYLAALERALPPVLEAVRPGFVIYLAGCDPASDDRLGNWKLTAEGIFARDRRVFELVRRQRRRLPLLVLLAGGYGDGAWRYTARFLAWVLSGGRRFEPPTTEAMTLDRFRRLARSLSRGELGAPEDKEWSLSFEDVAGALGAHQQESRFLGFYTRQGIELALERYGFLAKLRQLGFRPTLGLELGHPGGQTLRIHGDPGRRELLVELRVRRDRRTMPGAELLWIEWLMLQNPRLGFLSGRPPLPGQKAPGLGMLREVISLLILVCERIGLDGIAFVPSHFHLAVQAHGPLRFAEPLAEARYRAMVAALHALPLGRASEAVDAGRVEDAATDQPARWERSPMVLPVTEALKDRLAGEEFRREVDRLGATLRYRLAEGAGEDGPGAGRGGPGRPAAPPGQPTGGGPGSR